MVAPIWSISSRVSREILLGVDFGTSYTSAGELIDGRVELVVDNGDPMIPSVVHIPDRGPAVVGRVALNLLLAAVAGWGASRILGRPFFALTKVEVARDVRTLVEEHAGGRVLTLSSESYGLLGQWARQGHTRTGSPPTELRANVGSCRS